MITFDAIPQTDISGWQKGDGHMITATWGNSVAALYIDGVLVGTQEYDGDFELGPAPPLTVNPTGGESHVTNVQLYPRVLSADEVTALFVQPPRD